MKYKELYEADIFRSGAGKTRWKKQFFYYFRRSSTTGGVKSYYYRWRFKLIKEKKGIDIGYNTKIGKGLYLGHPWNITINSAAEIGDNCNIHKGVVIGQENRGRRKGVPIIGDEVWIGINAVIVGNIKIGNDVLIAPNSYVNFDVPDHSIVFGNPGMIKQVENATKDYINNKV